MEVNKGGFATEIIGDESGLFTFVINKLPQEGQAVSVEIMSVTKTNLEFIGAYRFKAGELIENYTGISQSMRLINPDEKATLTVTLKNHNPITHEFTKNTLSNFPIGSIVSSVLDFNQFSKETKNNPDGYFDPTTSKWAPADGRKVVGSEYQRSYNDVLPDLRGQFLRGLNQFYSSGEPGNYENGKDIGQRISKHKYSYQQQSTKMPNRAFSNSGVGNHPHGYQDIYWMEAWGNTTAATGIGSGGGDNDNKGYQIGRTTAGGGAHNHTISGGDKETRPNNLGVYFYIRINK